MPLFYGYNRNGIAAQTGYTAHNGRIVCKPPVPMHLHKAAENISDIIQPRRPAARTRKLYSFIRRLAQSINLRYVFLKAQLNIFSDWDEALFHL